MSPTPPFKSARRVTVELEPGHRQDRHPRLPFPVSSSEPWRTHTPDGVAVLQVTPQVMRLSADGIAAYVATLNWLDAGEAANEQRLAEEVFADADRARNAVAEAFRKGFFTSSEQHAEDAAVRLREWEERTYGTINLPEPVRPNPDPNEADGSWSGVWPPTTGSHAPAKGVNVVYVLHDPSDAPLYAGSTNSFILRMRAHIKSGKEWSRWTAEPCDTRADAYKREAELIEQLMPPLNVQGWLKGVAR